MCWLLRCMGFSMVARAGATVQLILLDCLTVVGSPVGAWALARLSSCGVWRAWLALSEACESS